MICALILPVLYMQWMTNVFRMISAETNVNVGMYLHTNSAADTSLQLHFKAKVTWNLLHCETI